MPEEKPAYRTQGCYAMINACKTLNSLVPEDAIRTPNIYRIGFGYRLLCNDVPELERPALIEKLKQEIDPYSKSERFKDIVSVLSGNHEPRREL